MCYDTLFTEKCATIPYLLYLSLISTLNCSTFTLRYLAIPGTRTSLMRSDTPSTKCTKNAPVPRKLSLIHPTPCLAGTTLPVTFSAPSCRHLPMTLTRVMVCTKPLSEFTSPPNVDVNQPKTAVFHRKFATYTHTSDVSVSHQFHRRIRILWRKLQPLVLETFSLACGVGCKTFFSFTIYYRQPPWN